MPSPLMCVCVATRCVFVVLATSSMRMVVDQADEEGERPRSRSEIRRREWEQIIA